MAVPKKRRCVEPQEQSTDSEAYSDDENNQGNESMDIIQVDFDVKIPEYEDREGIKNLLQQLFLKAHVSTFELADLLIEQNNITGVIKFMPVFATYWQKLVSAMPVLTTLAETCQPWLKIPLQHFALIRRMQATEPDDAQMDDDDDDMDVNFGVFSIINLTAKKDKNCVKQICSYLLDHCREVSSKSQYETFKNILEDPSKPVGLVISERFVNIPGKISVPLYHNLSKDVEREAYNFAYYIIISKIVNFRGQNSAASENEVYLNPEEELIAEEAELSFEFQVQAEQDSGLGGKWTDDDDEGIPKRKVLMIPASKWETVCNKLSTEFGVQST